MNLDLFDKVGTTISANVETSGRSSAHANAYDALNAVEICTAPAAAQVASSSQAAATSQLSQPADRLKDPQQDQRGRGWEGLASFLFGNDWFSIPLEGEEEEKERARKEAEAAAATSLSGNKDGTSILQQSNGNANVSATTKKPGGKTMLPSRPPGSTSPPKSGMGKQFATLKATDKTVQFSLERKDSKGVPDGGPGPAVTGDINGSSDINVGATGRWHAPYPNTIQAFPVVKNATSIANPHRFTEGSNISLSLHDLATEMEACRDIPPAAKKARRGSASAKDGSSTVMAKTVRVRDEVADKAMRKALRIPDDVYTTRGTIWGMIQDKNDGSAINRKKEAVADGDKKPAAKKSAKDGKDGKTTTASKVKFDLNASKKTQEEPFPNPGISGRIAQEMPSYVPNFLPPFPTDEYSEMTSNRLSASMSASVVMGDVLTRMHHREKRKTPPSAAGKGGDIISERDAVRRSLIGLGKPAGSSYWGSSWLENDTNEANRTSKSNNSKTEQILSEITVAEGEGTAAVAKKPESNAPQVAPLGRASGSEVSSILYPMCLLFTVTKRSTQ